MLEACEREHRLKNSPRLKPLPLLPSVLSPPQDSSFRVSTIHPPPPAGLVQTDRTMRFITNSMTLTKILAMRDSRLLHQLGSRLTEVRNNRGRK